MASAPRADLFYVLPLASCQGAGGYLPTANLGNLPDNMHMPAVETLPTLHLQIRSLSGWVGTAYPPGVGLLASPSRVPTAAAGPRSTSNYLCLKIAAPLLTAVVAAQPELWLFTYYNHRRQPKIAQGAMRQANWGYPSLATARHQGPFWGRTIPYSAATEFWGPAVEVGPSPALHQYCHRRQLFPMYNSAGQLGQRSYGRPRPGQLPQWNCAFVPPATATYWPPAQEGSIRGRPLPGPFAGH